MQFDAVGLWRDDFADFCGGSKAVLVEHRHHLVDGLGRARHQQAATGLWVGQQGLAKIPIYILFCVFTKSSNI